MAEVTVEAQAAATAERHIGDGVYVSFDGFQIWLAVNDHRNRVVALDPSVLQQLVRYAAGINAAYGVQHFPGVS
jgi:hypothetical protein